MTNVTDPPAVQEPRQRRSPWVAVLLLVALAITLGGIFPFRQIIAQQRQVDLARQKLAALHSENELLEEQIGMLESPAELERIAREELGLVAPGEVAYAVPQPEDAPMAANVDPVVGETDDRDLLERIWDFLTGRDLAPDG